MIETGHLNAIVFWFDLHLDEDISITSAPAYIGLGGELLADAEGSEYSASGREPQQNPVRARGKSTLQSLGRPQEAPLHPPCSYTAGDGHSGHFFPARVCPMACLLLVCGPQPTRSCGALAKRRSMIPGVISTRLKRMYWLVKGFQGAKAGFYFGTGQFGLGYYTDILTRNAAALDDDADGPLGVDSRQPINARPSKGNWAGLRHEQQEHDAALASPSRTEVVGSSAAGAAEVRMEEADRPVMGNGQQHDSASGAAGQPASAGDVIEDACTTSGASAAESNVQGEAGGSPAQAQQRPQHYWGQALQYLEKSADVTKGLPRHRFCL